MGGLLDVNCSLNMQKFQVAFDSDKAGARDLRSGTLLGVWREDGPADVVPLTGKISGSYGWWPEENRSSILGLRRLVGPNNKKLKLVVWNDEGVISREVRGPLDSSHLLEFKFDGQDVIECIPVRDLLEYVPPIPVYSDQEELQIDEIDSQCAHLVRGD
jgi:hypothetical protein